MSRSQYDYEAELRSYSERIGEYKDAAQRLINASSPEELIRTAADVVGTPLSIELLKQGIKKRFAKSAVDVGKKVDDVANKVVGKAREAKASLEGKLGQARDTVESRISDARATAEAKISDAENQVGAVRNSVEDQLDTVRGNLAEAVPAENTNAVVSAEGDSGVPLQNTSSLRNAFITSEGRGAEYNQTFMNPLFEQPKEANDLSDPFETTGESNAFGVPENASGVNSFAVSNDSNVGRLMARPAEETGALRGDSTLARAMPNARQAAVAPEPEMQNTSAPKQGSRPTDVTQGEAVENEISANTKVTEQVTGITDKGLATAEAETGENIAAEEGLTTSGEVAEAGESAVAAGEAVAETTGAETDGIGAIVGGLVALGGVLASIFAPHHYTPPPPPPNLAKPALQPGL